MERRTAPLPWAKARLLKLIPNLEQVTCREPTVTSSRLAISSRPTPCVTQPLIFAIFSGVNFLSCLPLTQGASFSRTAAFATDDIFNPLVSALAHRGRAVSVRRMFGSHFPQRGSYRRAGQPRRSLSGRLDPAFFTVSAPPIVSPQKNVAQRESQAQRL